MINEIQYLYPLADFTPFTGNVSVSYINGIYTITFWNTSILGVQPTQAALDAVTLEANSAISWATYQQTAKQALIASNEDLVQCIETTPIVVPAAWITYRQQLKSIISATTGDPTQPLPTPPAPPTSP